LTPNFPDDFEKKLLEKMLDSSMDKLEDLLKNSDVEAAIKIKAKCVNRKIKEGRYKVHKQLELQLLYYTKLQIEDTSVDLKTDMLGKPFYPKDTWLTGSTFSCACSECE
jgi:uncharacterized protein (DUF111 family)